MNRTRIRQLVRSLLILRIIALTKRIGWRFARRDGQHPVPELASLVAHCKHSILSEATMARKDLFALAHQLH